MYGMPAFDDPLGTIPVELGGLPSAGSAAPEPRWDNRYKVNRFQGLVAVLHGRYGPSAPQIR